MRHSRIGMLAGLAMASMAMAVPVEETQRRPEPREPEPPKKKAAKPIYSSTVEPPKHPPQPESRQVRRAKERALAKRTRDRNYQFGERRR